MEDGRKRTRRATLINSAPNEGRFCIFQRLHMNTDNFPNDNAIAISDLLNSVWKASLFLFFSRSVVLFSLIPLLRSWLGLLWCNPGTCGGVGWNRCLTAWLPLDSWRNVGVWNRVSGSRLPLCLLALASNVLLERNQSLEKAGREWWWWLLPWRRWYERRVVSGGDANSCDR